MADHKNKENQGKHLGHDKEKDNQGGGGVRKPGTSHAVTFKNVK